MTDNNEKVPAQGWSASGGKSKVIKTYAEDMASVIENDREGLIKKIIHEEEDRAREKTNLSPESKKNKTFMFVSFVLVSMAISTISFFSFRNQHNTVDIEPQFTPLIFNDKSTFIEVADMDKDQIAARAVIAVKKTEVKLGGVEGIYLTLNKKILGLRNFMTLIKGSFVAGDANLVSNNFLLGVVNGTSGKDFFMLIKMRSNADIFDALRAWEGKMFLDLHGFFDVPISADTKYLLTKNFEDGIIQNKNARILYGTDGKIIMMYIYANDTSVVITNTENAAREIMLRLGASTVTK